MQAEARLGVEDVQIIFKGFMDAPSPYAGQLELTPAIIGIVGLLTTVETRMYTDLTSFIKKGLTEARRVHDKTMERPHAMWHYADHAIFLVACLCIAQALRVAAGGHERALRISEGVIAKVMWPKIKKSR